MSGSDVLRDFADEVGSEGAVSVVGGRTHWDVGGSPAAHAREVRAPIGVVEHQPEEMIVRVRAGTTVAELDDVLSERGQMVPLDPALPASATVGGVLAVGRSGLRRLRWGPVRDTALEIRFVSAEGRVIKAGGPVVKNVTGFDLCRLLVGSMGTIGVLAEVVLRVQPLPPLSRWLRSDEVDPFALRGLLHRPSSILWDGTTTWVLLEGHGADLEAEVSRLGAGWREVGAPPPMPDQGRRSMPPNALRTLSGSFVAEVGVGIVHLDTAVEAGVVHPSTSALQARVKAAFDPTGRLNPGRRVA